MQLKASAFSLHSQSWNFITHDFIILVNGAIIQYSPHFNKVMWFRINFLLKSLWNKYSNIYMKNFIIFFPPKKKQKAPHLNSYKIKDLFFVGFFWLPTMHLVWLCLVWKGYMQDDPMNEKNWSLWLLIGRSSYSVSVLHGFQQLPSRSLCWLLQKWGCPSSFISFIN